MRHNQVVLSVIALGLILANLSACGVPAASPTSSITQTFPATPAKPIPTVSPTLAPTDTPIPAALPQEHRIAIRVVGGAGEFYDRLSGEKFISRGNNFIRVAAQKGYSGETFTYHSVFNTNLYNPTEVETALSRMEAEGYNVVRVFIQGSCAEFCLGDPVSGLLDGYIANIADFLQKAKSHHIYVIVTADGEPGSPYYNRLLDTTWSENFGGNNKSYLTGGGVLVGRQFWQDLVAELKAQNAPLDAILAYELRNELFFDSDAAPLSFSSGSFTTANGKTYDMASADERQKMMDENLLYWIDQVRGAILERDPTALVTVGFFVPQKPNPTRIGDPRLIETRPVIWESSLDFIDMHPYPGFGVSLPIYAENFGMQGAEAKPIVMGEFGAVRSSYSSEANAAMDMQNWQVQSCQLGFDGWLFWTYDMPDQVFYNAVSGAGEINQVLAPTNRPDPCQAGDFDFIEQDLALGASAEASRYLPDQPPSGAVDGTGSIWWGAGDFAPQWILIDLGAPQSIGTIRLVVTQSPAGETLHQVWVGASVDDLHLLHTFEGYTIDGQVLEFSPDNPLENVRYIRVNTRQSPSGAGGKEIEVLAPGRK